MRCFFAGLPTMHWPGVWLGKHREEGSVRLFADSDKCHALNGKYKSVMDYPMLLAYFKLKHSIELTLTAEFL